MNGRFMPCNLEESSGRISDSSTVAVTTRRIAFRSSSGFSSFYAVPLLLFAELSFGTERTSWGEIDYHVG